MIAIGEFRPGHWRHSIAVRDFIIRNVSPYEGDETFLVGSRYIDRENEVIVGLQID